MNKKASINLMPYANAKSRRKNKAITILKFNFKCNQIKISVKEQVEHVEHTIYLFYRKSQGL